MELDPDEVAGVVDLFGGLTRPEVHAALSDVAARSGRSFDADDLDAVVERALEGYYLVEHERGGETLLVAGPAALPTLPDGGEDLPHLLDVDPRPVDLEAVGRAALSRLHGDAARAVDAGDGDRVATLLDVCYDVEAWAPVETAELRSRLDAVR